MSNKKIYNLSRYIYQELFEKQIRSEINFKSWITQGTYLLNSQLISKTNFDLRLNNDSKINISISNDINRFALSAIESVENVVYNEKLSKSASWNTIKLYYASFFSVHSIMRLFGWSFIQLEHQHLRKITEIANATNMNNANIKLENGFYLAKYNNKLKTIEFIKKNDSHKDTWSSFKELLQFIKDDIQNNHKIINSDKIDIITFIDNLNHVLSKDGNTAGNWLSSIRNKVNYQHSFGTWFPYGKENYSKLLKDRNFDWKRDIDTFNLFSDKTEIELLYTTTNLLICLLHSLLKFNFELKEEKSHVLKNGYFKLVNLIQ